MVTPTKTDSSNSTPVAAKSPQKPTDSLNKGKLERQRSLGMPSSSASMILRDRRKSLGGGIRDFFNTIKSESSNLLETKWTKPNEFAILKRSLRRTRRHTIRRQSGFSLNDEPYEKILSEIQDHICSHPLEVITFIERFTNWDKSYKYLDTHKEYAAQIQEVFKKSLSFLSNSFKEYEAKLFGKLNSECIVEAFKYNEKLNTVKQQLVLHFQRKLKENGFSKEIIDSVDDWPSHVKGLEGTIREFRTHVHQNFSVDGEITFEEKDLDKIINLSIQEGFNENEEQSKDVLVTAKMIRKLNLLSNNISNYVQFFILKKPRSAWRRIQTVIHVAQYAIETKNYFLGKSIHTALVDGIYVNESSLPYVWETFNKKKSTKNARLILSNLCELLSVTDNYKKLIESMLTIAKNDSETLLIPHTPYLLTKLFLLSDKIETNRSDYRFEKFKCRCMKTALNKPVKLKKIIDKSKEKSPRRKYVQSIQDELKIYESNKSELIKKWKAEIESIQKALKKMDEVKDDHLEMLYSEIKSFIELCINNSKKRNENSQPVVSDFIKTVLQWHKKEPSHKAYSLLKRKANEFGERKQIKKKKPSPRDLSNGIPNSHLTVVQNPLVSFSQQARNKCPKMTIRVPPSTEELDRFLENPYINFLAKDQTKTSTPSQLGNGNDSIG